jgi:hypothetical protein
MSYYYFAATLPMLMPDQPPPFSVADFRAQCESHLAPGDLAALDAILGAQPAAHPHPFSRRWKQADGQLRNALARTRAERMRLDAATHIREIEGYEPAMEEAVREAYARPNPLQREKAIDHIRWDTLEALAGMDPFASSALLAYGLQLTILERWARMDKDTGAATVETLVQRTPADEEAK